MELFRNFHFLFVEKKGFVDTASIIAIRDPDGFTCIDVGGGGEQNIKLTTDLLEEDGINISDINTVIISHTHADHMGAIAHFKSLNPDIIIVDHEEDAQYLSDNKRLNHIFESDLVSRHFPEQSFDVLEFYEAFCPISEAKSDRTVVEGDTIDCGDYTFEVLHTPGHHPGHISLYESNLRALFVGDMVGMEIPFYNSRSGGVECYLKSLEKYQNLEIDLILPSHGELIYNPYEVLSEIKRKIISREKRIVSALSKTPNTFHDLLPTLFRNQALFIFPGTGILSSHLDKLKNEGRVRQEGQKYFLV
ncbi:MAG: MBL fold metallo-hydrolase [Deltaproteobacteria bacterium]|nr:MBL fold metallo-hydrolase [Deltaproteobacteria bacterium]